jgi:hypothetical protein
MDSSEVPEARVAEMIAGITAYMQRERSLYLRASGPLAPIWKSSMQDHFSKSLLDSVKTITLNGARIPPPPFYSEAMAISSGAFPDFVHLASVTYIDVIVFNDAIAPRTLFHGLVHAQQMASLGLETYVSFYLRGFLKTRSWITTPLEAQAFQLEARFSLTPPEVFSVEEEITRWTRDQRY